MTNINLNPNNLSSFDILGRVNELAYKATYECGKTLHDDLLYDFKRYFKYQEDVIGLFIIAQLEALINGTQLPYETIEAYWSAMRASKVSA